MKNLFSAVSRGQPLWVIRALEVENYTPRSRLITRTLFYLSFAPSFILSPCLSCVSLPVLFSEYIGCPIKKYGAILRPLPYLLNKCLQLFNEIYFVSCDIDNNSVLLNFSYFESFCLNIQTKNPKVAWLLVLAYSFIGHPILLCLTVLFTLRPFTFLPLPFFPLRPFCLFFFLNVLLHHSSLLSPPPFITSFIFISPFLSSLSSVKFWTETISLSTAIHMHTIYFFAK